MSTDILPEFLHAGDVLHTVTGARVTAVRSVKRTAEGEPLYRVRFASGIIGHRLWTRDELQAEGCTIGGKT